MDVLIVEPVSSGSFYKGWLFNVAVDMLRARAYNCIVLHDVDYLPLANVTYDACVEPTQVVTTVHAGKAQVAPVYGSAGVMTIAPAHYRLANGFSNLYYGWGGEDDDFSWRLTSSGHPLQHAKHGLFRHMQTGHTQRDVSNYKTTQKLLNSAAARKSTDGMNSLRYKVSSYIGSPKLAWALVDVD